MTYRDFNMTNLEILIEFLDLEGEERNEAILANFEEQTSDKFYIGEDNCYMVLSWDDLENIVYNKEELFFEEMLDYLEDSSFYMIARDLSSEHYIKSVIRNLDETKYQFPGMQYLGESRGKYIFNVE